MKLGIKNIGIIKEGEIILDGLTVIAAENDTGKSTAGKILYCLINTINTYENEHLESVKNEIKSTFEELKKIFGVQEDFFEMFGFEFGEKKEEIFPTLRYFSDSLKKTLRTELNEVKDKLIKKIEYCFNNELKIDEKFIDGYESEIYVAICSYVNNYENSNILVKRLLDDLRKIVLINLSSDEVKKLIVTRNLKTEFLTKISNVFLQDEESYISFNDDMNQYRFNIKDEKVDSFVVPSKNHILKKYKLNTVYIESPLILDYIEDLCYNDSGTLYKRVENLYELLLNKRKRTIIDEILENDKYSSLISEIEYIISGKFDIENEDDYDTSYNFKKKNQIIDIKNTATGIKTFGIIELLLKNRKLNQNTVLIIDEPEVHLHPKWQIKYAKIIVTLVKELKIKVLLNSHSPFFIEAIEKYSKKFKLLDKTNFYTIIKDKSEEFCTIKNVNHNLEEIYKLQAQAYDDLDEDTIGDL